MNLNKVHFKKNFYNPVRHESIVVNRKGQNFGFGRNFGPKILQKGFRQFRPKNRKNRKSYFRPKQPISAEGLLYLDQKYDRNSSLSAETGPFGRNCVFRSISAFCRNCSLKILLFRFRPKPFRLTTTYKCPIFTPNYDSIKLWRAESLGPRLKETIFETSTRVPRQDQITSQSKVYRTQSTSYWFGDKSPFLRTGVIGTPTPLSRSRFRSLVFLRSLLDREKDLDICGRKDCILSSGEKDCIFNCLYVVCCISDSVGVCLP